MLCRISQGGVCFSLSPPGVGGGGGACTVSCPLMSLHHSQYVRCGATNSQCKIGGVTSKIQVMPSVTVAMKSYRGRDSENDGEEGVNAEINKCAECDRDDKKLHRT
jgi:hypothetical protein